MLVVGPFETQLFVEAGPVRVPADLLLPRPPLHRSVETITVGPAKAYEAFPPPQTDLAAVPQKCFEIAQGAILGPEGVLVEKTLQLDSASRLPACRTAGPRPNQRKPGALRRDAIGGLGSWHKPTGFSLPSRSMVPR